MLKKALLVVIVLIVLLFVGAGIYFAFLSSGQRLTGNIALENGLTGHTFVINKSVYEEKAVSDSLSNANIHSYNVIVQIAPLEITKGPFATSQTVGEDNINLSGVDVEIDKDQQLIRLTIYLNNEQLTNQEAILYQLNFNYIKGLLLAAATANGIPESPEPIENSTHRANDIIQQIGNDYFLNYE